MDDQIFMSQETSGEPPELPAKIKRNQRNILKAGKRNVKKKLEKTPAGHPEDLRNEDAGPGCPEDFRNEDTSDSEETNCQSKARVGSSSFEKKQFSFFDICFKDKLVGNVASDLHADSSRLARPMPKSSGLFHFSKHLMANILNREEIDELQRSYAENYAFGELCAGVDTGTVCAEALKRAGAHTHGLSVVGHCLFYTECSALKRSALECVHKKSALAQQPATTIDMQKVDVPEVEIIFCGVVCKDVSPLTTTPKSVLDPDGKSGSSFFQTNE